MLQKLEIDNEKQISFLLGVQLAILLKEIALVDILQQLILAVFWQFSCKTLSEWNWIAFLYKVRSIGTIMVPMMALIQNAR